MAGASKAVFKKRFPSFLVREKNGRLTHCISIYFLLYHSKDACQGPIFLTASGCGISVRPGPVRTPGRAIHFARARTV
jgi:hypothetical protein